MRVLLLYHYMKPDDVVSAIHFSELGEGLSENSFYIEAWPGNRSRRSRVIFPMNGKEKGVTYKRVHDVYYESSKFLRLASSLLVQLQWIYRMLFRRKNFDVIILGTDPIFSTLFVFIIKRIFPKVRILYWIFDLHPEASLARSNNQSIISKILLKILSAVNKKAYQCVDKIIVIGNCMEKIIRKRYDLDCSLDTIIPWSLASDSIQSDYKKTLKTTPETFNGISVIYTGHYGEAHDLTDFLKFAEYCCNQKNIGFFIAGNARNDKQINHFILEKKLTNVNFLESVPYEDLFKRLQSFDYHWVSIRQGFTGIVVPSKFFSALHAGRGIIINSEKSSSVWQYTKRYDLGYTIPLSCDEEIFARVLDDFSNVKLRQRHFANAEKAHKEIFERNLQLSLFTKILTEFKS